MYTVYTLFLITTIEPSVLLALFLLLLLYVILSNNYDLRNKLWAFPCVAVLYLVSNRHSAYFSLFTNSCQTVCDEIRIQ